MRSSGRGLRITARLAGIIVWVFVLVGAVAWPAAGAPGSGSAQAGPPGPLVELNAYCSDHGAVGHLADGRTVYCTQVMQTDAFVWSYSRSPIPRDPNTRDYSCDAVECHYPDGSDVPGYRRCGILCGEPPTSGDVQSGLYDCFRSGTPYEECEARMPR